MEGHLYSLSQHLLGILTEWMHITILLKEMQDLWSVGHPKSKGCRVVTVILKDKINKKCSVQMQMYNLNDLQKKSAHMNPTCLTTLTIDFASRGKWSVETSNAVCLVLPYHVMSRVSRFLHFFVPSKLIQFKDVS